jgi:hypothetical protein
MDEVLQCAQKPKNEREMVLVFHQNDRSPVSARLIAPDGRLVGFGPDTPGLTHGAPAGTKQPA